MLDGFRKHSNSIVVKGLLFLLIASFAVWGIGDMLRPAATGSSVATVDGVEVSAQEVFNDYQREMARMRQLTGAQEVNPQMALAIGGTVVDRAVNRTLLAVAADDLDVAINDDLVRKNIQRNEIFQEDGKFSRARFDQIMFSNKLTEDQFIRLVRSDIAREQVISALANGADIPESALKALFKFREEKRSIDYVVINKDSVSNTFDLTDEEVRAFYDGNIKDFMAPEYRKVSLLHVTADDVASTIEVPLEKIEDAYSERQAEFKEPARRTVEQMVFSTEAEAKAAFEAINGGQDFVEVAKNLLGLEADSLVLGDVTEADLPEELRNSVFALNLNQPSSPIQSALGWHIIRVTKITDEVNPDFETVRDQLRDTVAHEMAADELYALSNKIEDALGGGATIEEAAQVVGMDLKVIEATDQNGADKDGNLVKEIFNQPAILKEVFTTSTDVEPTMKDDDKGGYFLVRLESVTESTPRPFETVKAAVKGRLEDVKKAEAAKAQAEKLVQDIEGGVSFADLMAKEGLSIEKAENISRFDSKLPADVVKSLFDKNVGDVALGEVATGYVIGQLAGIATIDENTDVAGLNALRQEMTSQVSSDLQNQFINALRANYKVSINSAMMQSMFANEGQ